MNDVLPKPFSKGALLNMLDKYLGHLKKSPLRIPGLDDSPAKTPTVWGSPGNTISTTAGMVSPAASVTTLADFLHAPIAVPDWSQRMRDVQDVQNVMRQMASQRPPRANPNGAAVAADVPFTGGGQRRDIAQVSGGADDDTIVAKRQHIHG
jgi:hypothetical protein